LKHLGVNTEGIEHWYRYADIANIRWGLTVEHRQHNGLDVPTLHAHTWRNALERTLLGALVPDGTRTAESLGIDALDDIDLSDIDDISALIKVFNAVLSLFDFTSQNHTTDEWCHALESSLLELCGEKCDDLATPLKQLVLLRASAANNTVAIPFSDVASILADLISQVPGRQPLRTGAITATSMIPLRGVPYRVVCVVGFDEEALSSSEGEGDDLIERQRLIGDQDTRLDVRRSLLDATLSAQDRLIITCTGQSIKNNQRLPPATPLAEFIDFAGRLGVGKHPTIKDLSAIEVEHPRHATSVRNFFKDQVQSGLVWSHDQVAREAASTLGQPSAAVPFTVVPVEESITLTPEMLETAFIKPIDLYLRHTLDMFTYRKNEKETPATLPLDMDKDKKEFARLAQELLLLRAQHPNQDTFPAWATEVLRSGNLPPETFGEKVIKDLQDLTTGMQKNLDAKSIDVSALAAVPVDLHVAEGIKLVGTIPMCTQGPEMITVLLLYGKYKKKYEWDLADSRIAIRLLIAKAVGLPVTQGYILARHEDWPLKEKYVVRELSVELDFSQAEAIRRLHILCEMTRTALVSPCASFGKTAEVINEKVTDEIILKMTKQFNAFVSKEGFHDEDEFIIFGNDIEFEDVFHMNSPIMSFWQRRNTLFTFPDKPDIDEEPKVHVIR
jgi:exodeoxyribonuclease V gamma subunit